MPMVGGKKYPYTKKGKAAAGGYGAMESGAAKKKAAKKKAKKK